MLQNILQESPVSIVDLITGDPLKSIPVLILWAVAFMYGWWAITGKQSIPRLLFVLTMVAIAMASLLLTFWVFPDMYDLAQTNPLHFFGAFLGSGAFGIIVLPFLLTFALGALMGFMKGRG